MARTQLKTKQTSWTLFNQTVCALRFFFGDARWGSGSRLVGTSGTILFVDPTEVRG